MSLIPIRYFIAFIALWGFTGLFTGYIHKNTDGTRCYATKTLHFGQWHTLFAIGSWELRYKPWNYDCDNEDKHLPEEGWKAWEGEAVQ